MSRLSLEAFKEKADASTTLQLENLTGGNSEDCHVEVKWDWRNIFDH